MTTPQERRIAAIATLGRLYGTYNTDETMVAHRDKIVAEIRKLADLGRSPRWKKVIDEWAHIVSISGISTGSWPKRSDRECVTSIVWAFWQYSVFAEHQA